MKLQLALDDIQFDDAIELAKKVSGSVDIFEMGTPFIIENGMRSVRTFSKLFPNNEILADTKIMDAGAYEAALTYIAGADDCTVMGITDDQTIKECVKTAQKYGKRLFVDTICISNPTERIPKLEALGVRNISVHVGVDQQSLGESPLSSLKKIKAASKKSCLSVAGGIKLDTVNQYRVLEPDIVIVGGGILHADDPAQAAQKLAAVVHS
ncbi:3-hexulose-6-phosphate synthase [Lactobacillus selangorensis]|nr:3-hexulose-6-phosphate synthase [Lactobacillus selangorensis]